MVLLKIISSSMMVALLLFFIIFTTFTTHSMEEPTNYTLLKAKDKIIIALTDQEKSHSSYLSNLNTRHYSKRWKAYYIKTNIKVKDILFFKKIVHQPALYDSFSNKKYCKALTVAAELQAPLLYAELLNARLPQQAVTLIIKKYMCLKHMPYMQQCMVNEKECILQRKQLQYTINRLEEKLINEKFILKSNNLQAELYRLIATATLPQAVLLSLIRKTSYQQFGKEIEIIPHMPGYNAFVKDWTKEQQLFLCDNLPLKTKCIRNKTDGKTIVLIHFNA